MADDARKRKNERNHNYRARNRLHLIAEESESEEEVNGKPEAIVREESSTGESSMQQPSSSEGSPVSSLPGYDQFGNLPIISSPIPGRDPTSSPTSSRTQGSTPSFTPSPSPSPGASTPRGSSSSSSSTSENGADDFVPIQQAELPEGFDHPLYDGANLSLIQSYLAIMHFCIRFQPSREEKEALLKLIALHCPEENHCLGTLYNLEQFLGDGSGSSKTYDYCGRCHHLFVDGEIQCPTCETARFGGVNPANEVLKDFFLVFNLEAELKTRCLDDGFWNAIQHPFAKVKLNPNAIEDIYDGTLYPENLQPGDLTGISSTDGIKIFKSGNQNLWVVMLVINELHPAIRFKQDNMIMLGAWFGSTKPNFHLLMDPIATQVNGLNFVMNPPQREPRRVTFQLLALTADNQAKEAVLNLKSTHCPNCQQPPVYENNRAGIATVACFPYVEDVVERTTENILQDMEEAHDAQEEATTPSLPFLYLPEKFN